LKAGFSAANEWPTKTDNANQKAADNIARGVTFMNSSDPCLYIESTAEYALAQTSEPPKGVQQTFLAVNWAA
jgi:hypothetical protein